MTVVLASKPSRSRRRANLLPALLGVAALARVSACSVDDSGYGFAEGGSPADAGAGGESEQSNGGEGGQGENAGAGLGGLSSGGGGERAGSAGEAMGGAESGGTGPGGAAEGGAVTEQGGQGQAGAMGTGGDGIGGEGGAITVGGAGGAPDDAGGQAGGGGATSTAPTVVIAGEEMSGVLAELTLTLDDADGAVVSVTIDWGDVEESVAAAEPELVVSHEYPYVGVPYDVSITATDDDGLTGPAATTTLTAVLPTDGLLLHVPFDGSTVDLVGGTLTSVGAEVYVTDRHGLGERARDFWNNNESGSHPLVSAPHLNAFTESFTLAIWLDNTVVSGGFQGNDNRIVGQGDWFNLFSPGTGVRMGALDGLFEDLAVPSAATADNPGSDWRFYAGVVERITAGQSQIRLYVDGEPAATADAPTTFVNPGTCRLYIGPFANGDQCSDTEAPEFNGYPGYLDDVRVYARALAASEVKALFLEGAEP